MNYLPNVTDSMVHVFRLSGSRRMASRIRSIASGRGRLALQQNSECVGRNKEGKACGCDANGNNCDGHCHNGQCVPDT
jgi:hypothetical protein